MRVYVAGGSDEREAVVKPLIGMLVTSGVTITHDWTVCEGYERDSTVHERECWAMQDLGGVQSAHLVWVVMPKSKSEGCHVEMGAALALGKLVIVSGPHARAASRIFALLAEIHDTHASAYERIVRIHRKWNQ